MRLLHTLFLLEVGCSGAQEGDDGSSYFDSERFDESCVNEEAFSASLAELAASAPRERMISPVFSPAMEAVARESCVFAAAGRSVLLQVRAPLRRHSPRTHTTSESRLTWR